MAIKKYNLSWIGVYKASSNSYVGGSTIKVGGSSEYNSYIGIPSAVRDAIKTSKTAPKLYFNFNVTDGAEFDIGAHKETSNKGGGTMPWYDYTGLHPIYGTGWQRIDLTSAFMNDYKTGARQGIVLYGAKSNYGEAYGNSNNSNEAYFEVEGTWNTAPTMQGITSPVASTVADTSLKIDWKQGLDAESNDALLTYQLKYYDGSSWGTPWNVGAGVLTYTLNTTSKPETSSARIAIRAYDGALYSDWSYSPYFTIRHNKPPSKPTQLTPDGGNVIDKGSVLRVTWKHNDDGVQAGYRLAWRTVSDTGELGAWNYVPSQTTFRSSISQYHDFAPETFPLGEIEWTVKTKDQQGLESPYATYQRFNAGTPSNAPTILQPASGSQIPTSEVTVEWSSVDQDQYELEIWDSTFTERLFLEQGVGAIKASTPAYQLTNNTTYIVQVRILSRAVGLWSPWSSITFSTVFVPPAVPTLIAEPDNDNGNIVVTWTEGTGSTTPAVSTDVFRREYSSNGTNEWEMVATGQLPSDVYIDYTPASDLAYEYMVRTWGGNTTSADSEIVEVEVFFDNAYLHRALTPSDMLFINSTDDRSQELEVQGQVMSFANRRLPVYEFGINESNKVEITFTVYNPDDLRIVVKFLKLKETFLYRDNYGRRFYCVATQPKISDLPFKGFQVSATLLEVDYEG
ncbi:fibronectin type III domain-containing protein [Bacillus sporothermodurans]|uniref:hypothetical protein n=2 Tax=Heyndrickxia sporothermodurans TaxID=46224 RepID=UPI00192BE9E6|nr:hypothetical protein [Heyndrickxia sporothermodurans]MBL5776990.1 fibronectin type III domain-containing protein [Heyndrickxia sporothermodurans]MBL5886920.1 fibronectin type III domain-containing protein [Heyndrickxia sporothermodurans]MBL5893936.1 fibronectin type III domain-containing protein [Heyndrickxia sporothermodurans]